MGVRLSWTLHFGVHAGLCHAGCAAAASQKRPTRARISGRRKTFAGNLRFGAKAFILITVGRSDGQDVRSTFT
jgi:hypothetical protein